LIDEYLTNEISHSRCGVFLFFILFFYKKKQLALGMRRGGEEESPTLPSEGRAAMFFRLVETFARQSQSFVGLGTGLLW
jgi:hypothetical protein